MKLTGTPYSGISWVWLTLNAHPKALKVVYIDGFHYILEAQQLAQRLASKREYTVSTLKDSFHMPNKYKDQKP